MRILLLHTTAAGSIKFALRYERALQDSLGRSSSGVLDMTADREAYTDQSQARNIHMIGATTATLLARKRSAGSIEHTGLAYRRRTAQRGTSLPSTRGECR